MGGPAGRRRADALPGLSEGHRGEHCRLDSAAKVAGNAGGVQERFPAADRLTNNPLSLLYRAGNSYWGVYLPEGRSRQQEGAGKCRCSTLALGHRVAVARSRGLPRC